MRILPICSVLMLVALLGCEREIAPPAIPPSNVDSAPPIRDGAYAVYETSRTFSAPLVPLRRWIEKDSKIVAAMEETDRIKKPVAVVVLKGDWPDVNAVRRLEFSDGHYVLERVLENNFPTLFRYQIWNYTSAAGRNLSYAIGQQAWESSESGGAKLTWTYRLMPNAAYKRPFVQRFVDSDMRPLMDNALDRVQSWAIEAFSAATAPSQN
ncbi:MAG: hypothetical protein AAF680_11410 [Pseudomonadota bacterium]